MVLALHLVGDVPIVSVEHLFDGSLKLRRHPLVSIKQKDPGLRGLFDTVGLLRAPVPVHGSVKDAGAELAGDLNRTVHAAVVDQNDFLRKGAAFQTRPDVALLVSRQ